MEGKMSKKTLLPANKKLTRELAHYFIKNHLRMSLEPSEWHKIVHEEVITDRVERRVIVIIGAGASNDVGLPLAGEAREKLRKDSRMPAEALEEELNRLSQTYNLERDAFETCLRALSTNVYEAQKLRNSLQEIYNKKFMPILGYEVLAHMFKHRFIDAIINFNFDELLDQSIADELDQGEYHYILSDGDCPDENKLREDPELPFYIKPHGTSSHKSTLRFTREDYYGVPLDIQRVLKYLLTEKQVVLLVIGFGMQSLEFTRILEDRKEGSKLFYINLKKPDTSPKLSKLFPNSKLLKINPDKNRTFSAVIQETWDIISNSFQKKYRPRHIGRHTLVSNIFSTKKIGEQNVENYLRGRTVIELCLSIAKGKGLVTISRLAEDRSGKYFDHYKYHNPDANFYEMCKKIGLKDIGYSREAMSLNNENKDEAMKKGEEKRISNILNMADFTKQINFLFSRVQDNLDPEIRHQLTKADFRETLINLYKGQEVELRYPPSSPYTRIFRFPKPIPTNTTFKFYTEKLFKQEWEYLLLVAETGEWLTETHIVNLIKKKHEKNQNVKMFLIVADLSRSEELYEKYGKKIIASIKKLPWWEHNRHMTILVDKNHTPFSSIYFSRRLRAANIIPVFLDNVDDSLIALESFNAYWLKESFFKSDSWINSSDAKNFNKLFKLIERSNKRKKK
jgi:hypothetical protein